MTRAEWRAADRWRRLTQKQVTAAVEQRINNLVVFGTTHPEFRARMLDDLVNPPLLVYPEMAASGAR